MSDRHSKRKMSQKHKEEIHQTNNLRKISRVSRWKEPTKDSARCVRIPLRLITEKSQITLGKKILSKLFRKGEKGPTQEGMASENYTPEAGTPRSVFACLKENHLQKGVLLNEHC